MANEIHVETGGQLETDGVAGKVGIGTAIPNEKLEVAGNTKISNGYLELDEITVPNNPGSDVSRIFGQEKSGSGASGTGLFARLPDKGAITGSATGGSSTTCIDTGTDFVAKGIKIGSIITNTTSGGTGRITAISTTTNDNDTITFSVISGTPTFSAGNGYSVPIGDIRNVGALDWINVKDFGATGDGATDDRAAIQAAINAAPVGGTVFIPRPGNYYKIGNPASGNDCITIGKALRLIGDLSEIRMTTDYNLFKITSSDVSIYGLKLLGSIGSGFSYKNAIVAEGASYSNYISRIAVIGCEIKTWGWWGIRLKYVESFEVRHNKLEEIYYTGICGLSVKQGIISNNDIYNITREGTPCYGIALTKENGDESIEPRSKNIIVSNNVLRKMEYWEAIDSHGGENISITGNVLENVKQGIVLVPAEDGNGDNKYACKNILVSNNTIISTKTDGSYSNGISFTGASEIVQSVKTIYDYASGIIANNTIVGYGGKADTNSGGIRVTVTRGMVICNNRIIEPSPIGISLIDYNYDFSIVGNNIADPWSDTAQAADNAAINIQCNTDNNGYNIGQISANNLNAASKSADSVLAIGINVKDKAGNEVVVGTNYFESNGSNTYISDSGNKSKGVIVATGGNAGIGVVNPSGKLEIQDDQYFQVKAKSTHTQRMGGYRFYNDQDKYGFIGMRGSANSAVPGDLSISSYNGGDIHLGTGNFYPKVTMKTDGSVGIGETSPGSKLEVKGSGATSATSSLNVKDSAGNTMLHVRDDKRVGIGTTSPGAMLDVRGDVIINEDGADKDVRIEGDTDSALLVTDASADGVGVGTNTPLTKLHVNNNTAFDTDSLEQGQDTVFLSNAAASAGDDNVGGSIGFKGPGSSRRLAAISAVQTTTDADQVGLAFYTHSADEGDIDIAEAVRIEHDGKMGVKTSSPHYELTVNGTIAGLERTADPAEPNEGEFIIWMSDGTGKGDDGDVLIASKAGGVTKWNTLFDHSAGNSW